MASLFGMTGMVPGTGDVQALAPAHQPADAFVWGAGGERLTPDELMRRREVAQALMASNYSPVGSVWEGLGRVADNVLGAIDSRQLDKAQAASTQRSDAVLQALMGNNANSAVAAQAIADPYLSPEVRKLATMQWERLNPKPSTAQPYRWEDNAGNVWELQPDGSTKRIFTDVVPKYYVQGDQAVMIGNPYLGTGAPQQVTPSGPQPGTVEDGYRFKGGNPADPSAWEPVAEISGEYLAIPQLGRR